MKILAVIVEGRHAGANFFTEYVPVLKMPIESKDQISIGELDDGSLRIGDQVEYKECFRSVDHRTVLYAQGEDSRHVGDFLARRLLPTYPFKI